MFIVLALLLLVNSAVGDDDCEPGFADTCFEGLVKDIKYMINLRTMQAVNISRYAVDELCVTLDDSLNCTSDIIDSECTEQEGKSEFDLWLSALRGAYHYVCDGTKHIKMTDILHGAPCWSITDFILCTEEKAKLPDISHILHVPLDDAECSVLHQIMSNCREKAVVGSCLEQEYVFHAVDGMIHAFFDATVCFGHRIWKPPEDHVGMTSEYSIEKTSEDPVGTTSEYSNEKTSEDPVDTTSEYSIEKTSEDPVVKPSEDSVGNVGNFMAALSPIILTILQVLVFVFVL